MVEFAPTPVFIVKSRTEKEMRVSLRKILPDKRRMCHSVRLFFFFFFFAFCILLFCASQKGLDCTLRVLGCVHKYV